MPRPEHQRSSRPLRSRRLAASLLAVSAAGCGRQFDLGEISGLLEPSGAATSRSPLFGDVLYASRSDLDVVVSDSVPPINTTNVLPIALGDVDGDGFGDWIQGDTLLYGGPRPDGTSLDAGGRAQLRFDVSGNGTFEPAGDVNGDGLMDILFGSEQLLWVASDAFEPVREYPLRQPAARLILGSRERLSGSVDLASIGVPFGDRDDLLQRVAAELDSDPPGMFANQQTLLRPLGDLDADGFADFVSTTSLILTTYVFDPAEPTVVVDQRIRRETVSYLHRGAGDLIEIEAPHARLDADASWSAAGDLDGDGLGDVIWTTPERFSILPGSVAEQGGELRLEQAVAVDGVPPRFLDAGDPFTGPLGDLDADGFADFALNGALVVTSPSIASQPLWLFYGAPGLLAEPLSAARASAMIETQVFSTVEALGDWDGDGYSDLLLMQNLWAGPTSPASGPPSSRESLLLRGSAERFSGTYVVPQRRAGAASATDAEDWMTPVAAGDLDGDGFADLFMSSVYAGFDDLGIIYGRPAPLAPLR